MGLGSLGMDYLATVPHFPQPDEKMRTMQLEVRLHSGRPAGPFRVFDISRGARGKQGNL